MPTDNRTVEAILPSQSDSAIITTINHNFQVITERIKELNISLSYLDLLKISTIFKAEDPGAETPDPTVQQANLQNFVSTCWNTLANYAGVYIQCSSTRATVFRWMNKYDVKNGDFIVKLPNNQSLYLAGASPLYMVPAQTTISSDNFIITFRPASEEEEVSEQDVTVPLSNIPIAGLTASHASFEGNTTINPYADCRFYIGNEEVFFPNYKPGTTFTIPSGISVTAYYIATHSNS